MMASRSNVPLKRSLSLTSDEDCVHSERGNPSQSPGDQLPTPPSSSPPPQLLKTPQEGAPTARSMFTEYARTAHPDITPQNDFELLMLGGSPLRQCTTAEKRTWLSRRWESLVTQHGSPDAVLGIAKKTLDSVLEQTGRKPDPNDPHILLFSLDGSEYTMRLWPGSALRAEYCLDFIETKTGKLVNVPDDFQLWFVPTPSAPWLQGTGPVPLLTIERSMGLTRDDYPEGEEKIVVRDGMTCVLRRPGAKDAIFTIPLRQQPRMAYYNHMVPLRPHRAH